MNEENINIVVSFDYSQVEAGVKKIQEASDHITKATKGMFSGMDKEATRVTSASTKAFDAMTQRIEELSKQSDYLKNTVEYFSELTQEATKAAEAYRTIAEDKKEFAVLSAGDKNAQELLKEAQAAETLAKQYEKLAADMQAKLNAASTDVQLSTQNVSAVNELNNSYKELTQTINNVVTAFQGVNTTVVSTAEKVNTMGASFQKIASMENVSNKWHYAIKRMTSDLEEFDKGLRTNSSQVNSLVQRLSQLSRKFKETADNMRKAHKESNLLSKVFKGLLSYRIAKFLGDATAKAIAFSESIHTLKIAAGDSAKELYKFVNIVSEKFGLDKEEIISAVTAFKQMGRNMGLAAKQSNILARGFTLMAIDMQALYEIPLEDALSRLESVTTGYGRALKNEGMVASEAYLQEVALSLGITQRVASMSEANKLGLRYIAVMRQMENAQDEYAKTIESASNQLRVFKAQVSQTMTAIGSLFYSFVSKILPYVNGILMAIQAIIKVIAKLFGFELEKFEDSTGNIADSVGGIGDAAADASKKMKQLVAPFDELNILAEDTDDASGALGGLGGGLDSRILDAMKEYDSLYDKVRMKAHDVRDAIMHALGFQEQLNEETGELEWKWTGWDGMLQGLSDAWDKVVQWWDELDPGAKLATIFAAGWVAWLLEKGLSFLLTPFLPIGTTILSWLTSLLANIINVIVTNGAAIIAAVNWPIVAIIALIALIVAAIVDLWNNNEEFRDKVTKMLNTLWTKLKKLVDDIIKAFKKLIAWFTETFGPEINAFVQLLKDLWGDFRDFVGGIVLNILSFFEGFLDFLDGVFTLDIDKALTGLSEMFDSFSLAVANIFIFIKNSVFDIIDTMVNMAIRKLNELIESINSRLGKYGFHIPLIPEIDLKQFKSQYLDAKDLVGTGYSGYDDVWTYNEDYRVPEAYTYSWNPRDTREDFNVSGDSYRQNAYAGMSEFTASRGQDIVDKIIVQIGNTQVDAEIYKAATRGGQAAGLATVGGGFTG